jgi:aminopeptidase
MNPPNFEPSLQKYAELIVKVGLNVQPGQRLLINTSIETAPLVQLITRCAYENGCRFVGTIWNDYQLRLIRLQSAPRDSFEEFPTWEAAGMLEAAQRGDAYLWLGGIDPDLFKDQDPDLLAVVQQTFAKYTRPFFDLEFSNAMNWSVARCAVSGWAAKVFPQASADQQMNLLWDAIFEICRVNLDDPIAAWQEHASQLLARRQYLDARRYRALKYRGPGTDLSVGLADGHIWQGGADHSQAGIRFMANLPTEEVFTLPNKNEIEGVVTATKPLDLGGISVEDFTLTFEAGRVINFSAALGETILRKQLDTDEGSRSLGEVALVPHSSPIAKSGLLFRDGIYDENAACHLALGQGYRATLREGVGLSDTEFAARGGNNSNIHVDFMIGSGQIDIDGLNADGSIDPVMRQGEWAFAV